LLSPANGFAVCAIWTNPSGHGAALGLGHPTFEIVMRWVARAALAAAMPGNAMPKATAKRPVLPFSNSH
jgi:hypothetical protein